MMERLLSLSSLGVCVVALMAAGAHAADPLVSDDCRWGARLTTGSGGYFQTRIRNASELDLEQTVVAGVPYFVQVDATYAAMNTFQVFGGIRADFSVVQRSLISRATGQDLKLDLRSTSNAFGLPYALALGFRYYFNPQEVLRAYAAHQLLIGLSRAGVGFGGAAGLEWAVSNSISIHAEYGGLLAFALTSEDRYKIGAEILLTIGTHYRF